MDDRIPTNDQVNEEQPAPEKPHYEKPMLIALGTLEYFVQAELDGISEDDFGNFKFS